MTIISVKPCATGLFMDRVEAAKIALAAGQIEKLRYSRTELFSEDLYEAGMVRGN